MPAPAAKYITTGTADFTWDDFEVMSDICAGEEILEHVSKGGIMIPDVGDAQKQRWARLVAVGPGRTHENGHFEEMRFKVGDVVMFGKYQSGGEPIIVGGRMTLLFRQGDFTGRLKKDAASLVALDRTPDLKVVA